MTGTAFLQRKLEPFEHTKMRIPNLLSSLRKGSTTTWAVIVVTLMVVTGIGCNSGGPAAPSSSNANSQTDAPAPEQLSAERAAVKKEAVASFEKKIPDDLNNWWFKVALYETPNRFSYLVHMQYQEVSGTDTIKFPNLGIEPRPQLRAGSQPYSCIIGFLDKQDSFRVYKQVSGSNADGLRITTLKHYAVVQQPAAP